MSSSGVKTVFQHQEMRAGVVVKGSFELLGKKEKSHVLRQWETCRLNVESKWQGHFLILK